MVIRFLSQALFPLPAFLRGEDKGEGFEEKTMSANDFLCTSNEPLTPTLSPRKCVERGLLAPPILN